MSDLNCVMREEQDAVVVQLIGDASVANTDQLDVQLHRVPLSEGKRIVLDLSELEFIASIGMGMLVNFHKNATRRGATVYLAAMRDSVAQAMQRARLNDVFKTAPTVEQAIA